MPRKDIEEKVPDATIGTPPAEAAVQTVEGLRKILAGLPEGTKEREAWEKHGDGHIAREKFRDLWLDVRVPKKVPETSPKDVKK